MSGGLRTSMMIGGAVVLVCFGLTFLEKQEPITIATGASDEPDSRQEMSGERGRATRLDCQARMVEERIEFSRQVARELIAQRLTLWAAAAQLQNLDQCSAPLYQEFYASVFPQLYPGQSESERYCRRAMALVDSELVLKPAQRSAVLGRLHQELKSKLNNSANGLSNSSLQSRPL
jgi:hypothetical protein